MKEATYRWPVEIFYDDDADLSIVQGRKVAVLGYGSQGHAHALSLRDSGVDVRVGLPEGSKSRAKAEEEGLRVAHAGRGVGRGRPDHGPRARPRAAQALRGLDRAEPQRRRRAVLRPRLQHPLRPTSPRRRTSTSRWSRPKGPGHLVRRQFVDGKGVPVLIAVEQDASGSAQALALSYAKGIGGTRAGAHQDHVHRGDRDRPVRRAGRALRRRVRSWSCTGSRP